MGWSTVEWPPKNASNIEQKPKLCKFKKLIFICITLIFLFAGALGVTVFSKSNNPSILIQKYIHNYYEDKENNIKQSEQTEQPRNNFSEQPRTRGLIKDNQQETNRGSSDTRYIKELDMIATAYTHTGNPTASGSWPNVGVVAVDPCIIPIGTKLYIEGYGSATALDKGGAIIGNKIDLFMDNEEQALKWGVRQVKVYVIK